MAVLGRTKLTRGMNGALVLAGLVFLAIFTFPSLLFFPVHAQIGGVDVYSEAPVDAGNMANILQQADEKTLRSELFVAHDYEVFLMEPSGWRWSVLSVGADDAFALVRPWSDAILIAGTDIESAMVRRGRYDRSLASIIAHERAHLLVAKALGLIDYARLPQWKLEGYADYVAESSTIDAAEANRLETQDPNAPQLLYFRGRERVARKLAEPGMTAKKLFGPNS